MIPLELQFTLPPERIAKFPHEPRDHCKLLVVHRDSGAIAHRRFCDLPEYLTAGDALVLNDSRVIRARTFGTIRSKLTEVFFLSTEISVEKTWPCWVRPGRKVSTSGTEILFADGVRGRLRRHGHDFSIEMPWSDPTVLVEWLEAQGQMPLPPYLHRSALDTDAANYQTVYAQKPGSVAAPTAGLHFTEVLLKKIRAHGVQTAYLNLQVGAGTFAPLREESFHTGELHSERYELPQNTAEILKTTRANQRKIVAVGTTSVRTLESADRFGPSGETRIFIRPGHVFRSVDALVTNFHLPDSSLILLVAAFLGVELTQKCYATALAHDYRFYSYGDAMLIL